MHGLGWIRDLPDHRDLRVMASEEVVEYPPEFDLKVKYPANILPILDQGQIGSCVFNAGSRAVYFDQMKQKLTSFMPSRLEWYFWGRFLEGTEESDSGCSIRDAFKALNRYGVCKESSYKYVKSNLFVKPSATIMKSAALHKSVRYQSVPQNLDAIKSVLVSGYPIVFGISVYESFEQVGANGRIPMPAKTEQCLGGHGVEIEGYSDLMGCVIVANSWGAGWGDKGYCYIPYAYILNSDLAADFWYVETMENSG